jgi:hypothetical protein
MTWVHYRHTMYARSASEMLMSPCQWRGQHSNERKFCSWKTSASFGEILHVHACIMHACSVGGMSAAWWLLCGIFERSRCLCVCKNAWIHRNHEKKKQLNLQNFFFWIFHALKAKLCVESAWRMSSTHDLHLEWWMSFVEYDEADRLSVAHSWQSSALSKLSF